MLHALACLLCLSTLNMTICNYIKLNVVYSILWYFAGMASSAKTYTKNRTGYTRAFTPLLDAHQHQHFYPQHHVTPIIDKQAELGNTQRAWPCRGLLWGPRLFWHDIIQRHVPNWKMILLFNYQIDRRNSQSTTDIGLRPWIISIAPSGLTLMGGSSIVLTTAPPPLHPSVTVIVLVPTSTIKGKPN